VPAREECNLIRGYPASEENNLQESYFVQGYLVLGEL